MDHDYGTSLNMLIYMIFNILSDVWFFVQGDSVGGAKVSEITIVTELCDPPNI
jgi:hypothetical protein